MKLITLITYLARGPNGPGFYQSVNVVDEGLGIFYGTTSLFMRILLRVLMVLGIMHRAWMLMRVQIIIMV